MIYDEPETPKAATCPLCDSELQDVHLHAWKEPVGAICTNPECEYVVNYREETPQQEGE